MRQIKYIRFYRGFVLFSEPMTHNEIHFNGENPISAGFCYFDGSEWKCYGESISLKLKSKEEDSNLLTRQMNSEY